MSNEIIAFKKKNFNISLRHSSGIQQLRQFFKENDKLRLIFKKVTVAIYSPYFTIVPEELYDPAYQKRYLSINHHYFNNPNIAAEYLPSIKAYFIYSLPDLITDHINDHFEYRQIEHSAISLIEILTQRNLELKGGKVYVYLSKDEIELIVFRDGKFLLYNSYEITNPEDFIYFIMLVYDQLQLNPEADLLVFLGEIEKYSAFYDIAYKYIRNIRFGQKPAVHKYHEDFNALPEHYYFNLFVI